MSEAKPNRAASKTSAIVDENLSSITFEAALTELESIIASIVRQTELTSMSTTLVTATAGKQHGSFVLTNFALMGITNIVSANGNTVITTNSGVLTLTTASGSGGVGPTNANQFGASLTLSIKDGALLTNTSIRTALTLPTLTASRAAVLNSTGQLTNSAAVSDVEIEYLDGVTSAIQTQLNGKQNGQTNSSQFGASTVLTLADRLSVTNLNSYGTGAVFFGHVTVSSNITAQSFIGSGTGAAQLQLFSTNGNAAVLGISSDTISVTNVLGVSRRGTNNLMFDMNFVGKFTITNKFDFAASITFSNCAEGQEYAGILSGGGTSRVITFRADTNCLFADLDAFGVARATTKAVTLTNGNDMEISAYVTRPLESAFGTTNVINLITRQYAQ